MSDVEIFLCYAVINVNHQTSVFVAVSNWSASKTSLKIMLGLTVLSTVPFLLAFRAYMSNTFHTPGWEHNVEKFLQIAQC